MTVNYIHHFWYSLLFICVQMDLKIWKSTILDQIIKLIRYLVTQYVGANRADILKRKLDGCSITLPWPVVPVGSFVTLSNVDFVHLNSAIRCSLLDDMWPLFSLMLKKVILILAWWNLTKISWKLKVYSLNLASSFYVINR